MRIGIPKEPLDGQTLVAASPDTVKKLVKLGYDVCVEEGAGARASYDDAQYRAAGAQVVPAEEAWGADVVTCLDAPPAHELALMRDGATLVARMAPGQRPDLVDELARRGMTALALDMVPRISRAQALDVRSSMMNVAGNRAVIEAASQFGRLFCGQVTAAGKVAPAKVYVIGVGVAGLAAIGAAGSMGAEVYATDVRAEVADQVASLGATFVEIPVKQESADGYARALTDEEQAAVLKTYAEQAAKCDIVITTAQVPGRPAPLLLTEEAVAAMRPGSVIVDMGASSLGGNCPLSRPGEVVTTQNGVKVVGYDDLPSRLPGQSSQLFGQNVVNLMKLVTKAKDGVPVWDMDDEVVRGMTVTLEGAIMWPPPPVKVSAAPAQKAEPAVEAAGDAAPSPKAEKSAFAKHWWKVLLGLLGVALIVAAPSDMASHFIVFELAVVVGFYVITGVSHSLHTPLMSVTNAISGIIVVGALLLVGSDNPVVAALSFVAVAIASINVFGGFLVTRRMLKMFERSND
ncbi:MULTISPECIES: Re/Si-specific NAD(P)(+) transhydrogenase subunit alpha [unclassified Adlercreutzia]|uniref:Re/Si-specific NAD(P)(+) transhydrogenase subunit alpha n=1 Tax=unclassified Adlercreutzia TaxID=2636013 RepID=UPI0013EB9961|nr:MULTISPECIES: Re/Si-specific NAD(P)(+) transhydrogenase subunit alpha [unclassified Adlercreutzia]